MLHIVIGVNYSKINQMISKIGVKLMCQAGNEVSSGKINLPDNFKVDFGWGIPKVRKFKGQLYVKIWWTLNLRSTLYLLGNISIF